MKKIIALMLGLSGFGWAPGQPMFQKLKGEFEVGFKLLEKWDSTRVYGEGFRPMQVAVWFPTNEKPQSILTLSDMIKMGARSETLTKNEEAADDAIQKLIKSLHINPEAASNYIAKGLNMYGDSKVIKESFPVILYAPGSSAHWYDNYLLSQTLASHGYVVAAVKSRSIKSPTMSTNWMGVRSQVRDLEFALSQVYHILGYKKVTGVNVVGRSWGAIAALVFAIENESITKSIASLDGTLSYNAHLLLEDSPYPNADYVRKPLFLAVGKKRSENATPIDRKRYFKEVTYADVYQAEYDHMQHTAFGSYYLYYHFLLNKGIDETSSELLKEGYLAYCQHILQFLNYYNSKSAEKLSSTTTSIFSIEARPRAKQPLLDYQDFGYALEVKGPQAAVDFYNKTKAVDSLYARNELFNAGYMNNLAYQYLSINEINKSVLVLKLALDAFPENSNLHDSLGEMYFHKKDYKSSLHHYKESLRLDESNQNAKQMIAEIERLIKD